MDYNYVRMRNALKDGDLEKAEEYKLLYEGVKTGKATVSVLDYAIVILLCISVLLGAYILHSQERMSAFGGVATEPVVTSEVPK